MTSHVLRVSVGNPWVLGLRIGCLGALFCGLITPKTICLGARPAPESHPLFGRQSRDYDSQGSSIWTRPSKVERRQVTVVEKTYDERGYPVERTIVTQDTQGFNFEMCRDAYISVARSDRPRIFEANGFCLGSLKVASGGFGILIPPTSQP